MRIQCVTVALLGLLTSADARSLVASRTTENRADRADARDPPIPTSTLITDFQKDGVNSSWAEGHPKIWASAKADFQGVAQVGVSPDEKFIVVASARNVTIHEAKTLDVKLNVLTDAIGDARSVTVYPHVDGGYNIFVATENYPTSDRVTRLQISSEGDLVGQQTQYEGSLGTLDGPHGPFTKDGRRFLAKDANDIKAQRALIFDIDKPDSPIALMGHNDRVISMTFSPDDALVSTASWDSYVRLFNATTGELIHSFGPSGGQNWRTTFSPDGKYVALGTAAGRGTLSIWSLADMAAPPIVLSGLGGWLRSASWTPDSKLIAAGTTSTIHVYSIEEKKFVQRWQTEDPRYEARGLFWMQDESGLKLAYRVTAGLEVYDFNANLKYRWGPHAYAQYDGGGTGEDTTLVKSRGWIGGNDADGNVRFYDFA